MHADDVRELKWMILGAALMTTGSVFYTSSEPVWVFVRTLGFPMLILGIVVLVAGLVGYTPDRQR